MADKVRQSPQIRPQNSILELSDAGMALESPLLRPKSSRLKKPKSRPQMKRNVSSKFVFSVDDDVNDRLDNDFEESPTELAKPKIKYLEGYHDALRDMYQQKRNKLIESTGVQILPEIERDIHQTLLAKAQDVDGVANLTIELHEPELPDVAEEESEVSSNKDSDNASTHSTSSTDTIESLNLKDRQNAINSTHPFGIKIWKPSIYKKNRSVAVRAEEDIHDFDPRRPTGPISFSVHITNFIWTCTVGLLLYLVCLLGAVIVFVCSGFAWHKHLRPYVKLLLNLGKYWLSPFGKFVLLNKDENYLDEDELDGRSISEFHRWRLQEEGRLFFAPPRRMTNSDTKPLLKDHKGRPLRDAYSSLGEGPSETHNHENAIDDNPDIEENENSDIKVRFFGRGTWSSGRLMFYLYFYGILQPVLFLISALCWLIVFTIPMTNLNSTLCDHLRKKPLALHFVREKDYYKRLNDPKFKKRYKSQSIVLCTYRCCGLHYYKYTIDGTNIFFINLLVVVVFVILDFYLLKEKLEWKTWYTDSSFLFCGCLFSIIPLAYFIGQAVASISAQSSMGLGAVINAFFSTVVEIFLYCVALNQSKGKLVEGSMIGSILGGVLLLPGLSMCGGALKRKTQRYNPRSAGVSSTMLLFAMVVMFAPSLFYQMYGSYEIRCKSCAPTLGSSDCTTCRFIQPTLNLDTLYYTVLRPFTLLVAVALFLAYICGLYFTLKTHASLIWATNSHEQQAMQNRKDQNVWRSPSIISLDLNPSNKHRGSSIAEGGHGVATPRAIIMSPGADTKQKVTFTPKSSNKPAAPQTPKGPEPEVAEESGGHDAPNWSNGKSSVILLGATVLYAIIAEILVDNVDAVLVHFPINPKFLGLTVFALVPNTTEFVNAISFAVSGNVALSMEIGSAYALQVVLIQIPSLVVYSVVKGYVNVEMIFPLIFPRWDIAATLVSIYLFTYIYAEGKSNYFKGVILILSYIVVLAGFYLDDIIAELDDGYGGGMKPPAAQFLGQLLSR